MKETNKNRMMIRKVSNDRGRKDQVNERMQFAADHEIEQIYDSVGTTESGMSEALVDFARETYGNNAVSHGKKNSLLKRICTAFINPFTAILFVLAAVSAMTDIVMAAPGEKDPITVIIITSMVLISGVLRFVQETRSGNAAAKLSEMIRTTTCVERLESGKQEISLDEVVVGDIVHLSAGDMVPADIRIVSAKD